MTDDLISRADAIIHFVKASKNYECGMFDLKELTHELWQIPSAQPKQGDDLISRQVAIDALDRFSLGETDAVKLAFRMGYYLKMLPSGERKIGCWIPITYSEMTGYNPKLSGNDPIYGHRCSACNNECFVDDSGSDILSDYCPNCGAKMEVEHE